MYFASASASASETCGCGGIMSWPHSPDLPARMRLAISPVAPA
jgi:hypothetical protein